MRDKIPPGPSPWSRAAPREHVPDEAGLIPELWSTHLIDEFKKNLVVARLTGGR